MRPDEIADYLKRANLAPDYGTAAFQAWVNDNEFLSFLATDIGQQHLLVYASLAHCFVHSAFVPRTCLRYRNLGAFLDWNVHPDSTWGIAWSGGGTRPFHVSLAPPLERISNKGVIAEPLLFLRSFAGRSEDRTYFELSQKFGHSNGLHWVPERRSYSRFDDNGDVEDIVRVFSTTGTADDTNVITIRRDVMDKYLAVSRTALLRMFDSTRFSLGNFTSWDKAREISSYSAKSRLH